MPLASHIFFVPLTQVLLQVAPDVHVSACAPLPKNGIHTESMTRKMKDAVFVNSDFMVWGLQKADKPQAHSTSQKDIRLA